ncbi:MAG: class I tRNA ligase family protein, partial [Planctomycetota bacterium]
DSACSRTRHPLLHAEGAGAGQPVSWSELHARGYPQRFLPSGPGTDDEDRAFVTVATTRPETYLGDTAVAVHPDDPRATALDGMAVELPLVGRTIPIIRDDYVVMPDFITGEDSGDAKAQMATGFLKVTPAHDPNDWEIGQRHFDTIKAKCSAGEVVINVMAPDASISPDHGWSDYEANGGAHSGAHVYVGLSREDARKKVVKEFEARDLLEAVKPHRHSVGHSYRSHVAIEPYLSDQWYVAVSDDRLVGFAQRALTADQRTTAEHRPQSADDAGDGSLRFYPDRYAKTYETWHDNLRDWCISRQLWWGHRIPVWHKRCQLTEENWHDQLVATGLDHVIQKANGPVAAWTDGAEGMAIAIVRTSDGKTHDLQKDSLQPVTSDTAAEYDIYVCTLGENDLEKHGFAQDPDVLDTWFSSALWPLNTMGWPEPEQSDQTAALLDVFNPTNVLCTAREIITLWVSRMVMFNRYFLSTDGGTTPGHVPFTDVFIHAMIQDGEGRKMSKSLGNGVDPLDIIHSHGTDAMRFTLCKMTTQTQDVRMPVEHDPATKRNTSPKFDEGRNFCTKLWNATRFALMNLEGAESRSTETVIFSDLTLTDRWMLSRLTRAVSAIDGAIGQYQFSVYAQTIYDLLWRDFCDWYLEAIKPTVKTAPGQQAVLRNTLDAILRLLHPICPFITETLGEAVAGVQTGDIQALDLGGPRDPATPLCVAAWPLAGKELLNDGAETTFERVQALVEAIRQARTSSSIPGRESLTLHAPQEILALADEAGGVVQTLAGLGEVRILDGEIEGPTLEVRFEGTSLLLSGFEQRVDDEALRGQLSDQIAKLEKDAGVLDKRLNNPGYVDKAPAHMVQETRDQRAAKQAEIDELRSRLEALA